LSLLNLTINSQFNVSGVCFLDLVGITLASDPPVIEAVDVDRHLHGLRGRAKGAASAKKRGGGKYPTAR
jgi:hypothetical protein